MFELTKELRLIGNSITNEYGRNRYSNLLTKAFSNFNIDQERNVLVILNEIKQIISNEVIYYFEALNYSYLKDYKNVIKSCKIGLNIKETYYLYDLIAIAYHQLDNYDLALEMFDKSIELNDSIFEVYYDKAITMIDLYKDEDALKLLNKVITLEPNYAPAYKEKGFLYSQLGSYEKSYENYQKYIKLSAEEEHEVYYKLAFLLNKSNSIFEDKNKKILDYLDKAIFLSEKDRIFKSEYFLLKANTLYDLGKINEADFCCKTIINNPYSDIEDKKEALECLQT